MAHFARVVDGVVVSVHVLANAIITDPEGVEHEDLGQAFLAELHGYESSELIQCSYNNNFRGAYPGVGWSYDPELDEFLAPVVEDAGDLVEVEIV